MQAQVSVGMLSLIETGKRRPSLRSWERIRHGTSVVYRPTSRLLQLLGAETLEAKGRAKARSGVSMHHSEPEAGRVGADDANLCCGAREVRGI